MSRSSVNRGSLEVQSSRVSSKFAKKSSRQQPRAQNPLTKPSKEDELVEVHTCPTYEASIFERGERVSQGPTPLQTRNFYD